MLEAYPTEPVTNCGPKFRSEFCVYAVRDRLPPSLTKRLNRVAHDFSLKLLRISDDEPARELARSPASAPGIVLCRS